MLYYIPLALPLSLGPGREELPLLYTAKTFTYPLNLEDSLSLIGRYTAPLYRSTEDTLTETPYGNLFLYAQTYGTMFLIKLIP